MRIKRKCRKCPVHQEYNLCIYSYCIKKDLIKEKKRLDKNE